MQDKVGSDNKTTAAVNSLAGTKNTSVFHLIILAGQRYRQLANGAQPRIERTSLKTRNTKIAVEEVNRGMILFNQID